MTDIPQGQDSPDFSRLTSIIKAGIVEAANTGRPPKDFEHYIFEEAIEAIYGKDFWDWWNNK